LKIASDSWYSTSPEANLEIKTSMGCCKGIPQETSRNHSCSIPFVDVQAIPGIQDDKPWSLLGTHFRVPNINLQEFGSYTYTINTIIL